MKPNVRILATCRKPELLPFTLLVFRSIRIGFPTTEVHVDINPMSASERATVIAACQTVNATHEDVDTIHHKFIEKLVQEQNEPFYLVDTDLVLYKTFEQYDFSGSTLAGWRIPEWRDDYSRCITRARLHTSLLYIDPVKVRAALEVFTRDLPPGPFTPFCNPFYPLVIGLKQNRVFYDTCSLLYHCIGGRAFNDQQLDAFFHANFGTISDLVLPRLPAKEAGRMLMEREAVLNNPELGRGAHRTQMEYYLSKPV